MSYNYSSCQKKSKKSDPGFKFTGQRSRGQTLKNFFDFNYEYLLSYFFAYLKKKSIKNFIANSIFTKLMSLGEAG